MRVDRDVEILNGPIGAGKTRTIFTKLILRAAAQKPSTRDGVRKFKVCVVHANYRQLWRSTLPSWWKLMPRDAGEFTGAENAPAKHVVDFVLPDGSLVRFQIDFIAIGENAAEDVMRGYEPTAFFLNECDLLAEDVYTFARGRVGRYPDMSEGGPSWYGVVADCNAPELNAWLYQRVFLDKPADADDPDAERFSQYGVLLRQPSALSPEAENIPNLPPGYYAKQRRGQPRWYIARMIENKPGYSRAGKPIYPEFNDQLHVADHILQPIPGLALKIGLDAGGTPAACFGQRMPNGQWRIYRELTTEAKSVTGALRFADMIAKCLHENFEGITEIQAWADPSAAYGADKHAGEASWIEIVSARAALRVDPAPTNQQLPRWEAVRRPLTMLIDAGVPALLLSPACPVLREGFNSGYRFRKLAGVDTERYSTEVDKNEYSHPHDSLQYLLSAGGEDIEIRGRAAAQEQDLASRIRDAQHDWNPLG